MITLLATLLSLATWLLPVALVSLSVHEVDLSTPAWRAARSFAPLLSIEIRNSGQQSREVRDPPHRSLSPLNRGGLGASHSAASSVPRHLCAAATARNPGWVRGGVVVIPPRARLGVRLSRQGEIDPAC
jgi:hypothetical protein